jgi:hypothetical protein
MIDHYVYTGPQMSSTLDANFQSAKRPMFVEWGSNHDSGAQPATADLVNTIYAAMSAKPYISGVDYYQVCGTNNQAPERIVDDQTWQLTQTGVNVQSWFQKMMPVASSNCPFGWVRADYSSGKCTSKRGADVSLPS